jgi:hypothetical protein
MSCSDEKEGKVTPMSLTFNSTNWNSPQVVTISGVDDDLDDGNTAYTIIISAALSNDPDYDGLDPPDIPVINLDDDGKDDGGIGECFIKGLCE